MSNTARRSFRKCRAIVVTKDGKNHPTRWIDDKDFDDLDPDELPPFQKALKAAQRLAERKQLDVKQIDGQFTQPKETTP
ncbi:hypothetical protein [Bradyrhizobium sp. 150]|uniref:hypothetical protein n=1 Tax=Bradyrhizobium sp. 150 TaxID=2782625 RepID=UPI001FF83571|nr:hypothetical protein [Bradyrhizobium sp. 150]MCK1670344.1 hypothetical protein [Bradyrhizobium sp. 150]